MDLDALYQEIILDHYKNPQHAGLREPYEAEVHHVNPTCGDEVTLRVHLSGTGTDAIAGEVHAQGHLVTAGRVHVVHLGLVGLAEPCVVRVLVVVQDDLLVQGVQLSTHRITPT